MQYWTEGVSRITAYHVFLLKNAVTKTIQLDSEATIQPLLLISVFVEESKDLYKTSMTSSLPHEVRYCRKNNQ